MKKSTIAILVIVFLLVCGVSVIYLKIGFHYKDHFFEETKINGIDVSSMTADKAESVVAKQAENYQLALKTRDGKTEVIKGGEIGYRFLPGGEVQELLKKQNYLLWPEKWFGEPENYTIQAAAAFDANLLNNKIKALDCMQPENIVPAQDAKVEMQADGTYVVKDAVPGNELEEEKLVSVVTEAVKNGESSVDLETKSCYKEPLLTSNTGSLNAEAAVRNKYAQMKITLQMGGNVTEVLDVSTFGDWFSIDQDLRVSFNRDKIAVWLADLAARYNTLGTQEAFQTTQGETVYVEARTYGWQLDEEDEAEALYNVLMAGESTEHTPLWYESAVTRGSCDVGDTYVEIDYTNQHMWYYKNGALLVDTAVVTGNVSAGNASPEGIFCLVGKQEKAVLVGEDYRTPVDYWMPFFGGVGIHDADSWRTEYGGTIYQWGGSHGCINTPTAQAAVIFQNIEVGTPIICYSSGNNYGFSSVYVEGTPVSTTTDGIIFISEDGTTIDVTDDYFILPGEDGFTGDNDTNTDNSNTDTSWEENWDDSWEENWNENDWNENGTTNDELSWDDQTIWDENVGNTDGSSDMDIVIY